MNSSPSVALPIMVGLEVLHGKSRTSGRSLSEGFFFSFAFSSRFFIFFIFSFEDFFMRIFLWRLFIKIFGSKKI